MSYFLNSHQILDQVRSEGSEETRTRFLKCMSTSENSNHKRKPAVPLTHNTVLGSSRVIALVPSGGFGSARAWCKWSTRSVLELGTNTAHGSLPPMLNPIQNPLSSWLAWKRRRFSLCWIAPHQQQGENFKAQAEAADVRAALKLRKVLDGALQSTHTWRPFACQTKRDEDVWLVYFNRWCLAHLTQWWTSPLPYMNCTTIFF